MKIMARSLTLLAVAAALLAWSAPAAAVSKAQAITLQKVVTACQRASDGGCAGETGSLDQSALPVLAASNHPGVRCAAIYALGEFRDAQAVDLLVASLGDENPHVRRIAARALGKIGNRRALTPLSLVLRDNREDLGVRCAAAEALGMLDDPAAAEALRLVSGEQSGRLQWTAGAALQNLTAARGLRARK